MIFKNILFRLLLLITICSAGCSKTPVIDNSKMLDGNQIFDPSLYNPAKYLVSVAIDNPTTDQKNTPIVIAVHGYSASTYEWDEFRTYSEPKLGIMISQVLLGGHGRTYDDLKNASWKDWQESIIKEYKSLHDKGYTNINIACSSVGCPLVMDLFKNGDIGDNGLRQIFMIDPIVIPSDKLLGIIGLVGPMLGYLETPMTDSEEGHYYHFRPQETLKELLKLTEKTRKDLESGFCLPIGCHLKIYKSINDPTADAVSAVLIYKGLKNSDGSKIEVDMLESNLHVVTRLNGRENVTKHDSAIQTHVFDDMYKILTL